MRRECVRTQHSAKNGLGVYFEFFCKLDGVYPDDARAHRASRDCENKENNDRGAGGAQLAYTRYCFVSGLLSTNQYFSLRTHPLFKHPPPRHRLHYYVI